MPTSSIARTVTHSLRCGLSPINRPSCRLRCFARVIEKVVSNTWASGFVRARWTARCSATIVLPVPAEPDTRAGPLYSRSTISRWAGCRNTIHFSQGYSSALLSSSESVITRKRRCASGWAKGSSSAPACTGCCGVPPVASSSSASAASLGSRSARSNSVSSFANLASSNHSVGTP